MDFEKNEICRTSGPEVMSGRALIQEERSITSLFTTLQHSLLSLEVHNCEIAWDSFSTKILTGWKGFS